MKTGKTLSQLAAELERQQNAKRDIVADTRKLTMLSTENAFQMEINGAKETFPITDIAGKQIADHTGIPTKYYEKMPQELRAINVNHWNNADHSKRLVRTLDGKARAFLSERYKMLDNFDLAEAVLPVLQEFPDAKIESCELTDRRMYIKALFPRIEGELAKGDLVQSGVVISNSEIGQGSLRVEPLIYRLVCTNGLISNISTRAYHLGKALGLEDNAREIYRNETIKADNKAFWMKIQDTVRASVDQVSFDKTVKEMQRTMGMEMEADPVTVIERAQKRFLFSDSETSLVTRHLLGESDFSAFGLLNAVTRTAQDLPDYDRATEFERFGGQILELSPSDWNHMARAA